MSCALIEGSDNVTSLVTDLPKTHNLNLIMRNQTIQTQGLVQKNKFVVFTYVVMRNCSRLKETKET